MKISRFFLPVFLVILLLSSQQMGYAHALSHLSDTSEHAGHKKTLPGEKACEHCPSFAQIGAALTSDALIFFIDAFPGIAVAIIPTLVLAPRTFCVFHSRAPPALI